MLKVETESWASAFIAPRFLIEHVMWPAASDSCHLDFPPWWIVPLTVNQNNSPPSFKMLLSKCFITATGENLRCGPRMRINHESKHSVLKQSGMVGCVLYKFDLSHFLERLKSNHVFFCFCWWPNSDGEWKYNPWITWLFGEQWVILEENENGFLKDYLHFHNCHSASF